MHTNEKYATVIDCEIILQNHLFLTCLLYLGFTRHTLCLSGMDLRNVTMMKVKGTSLTTFLTFTTSSSPHYGKKKTLKCLKVLKEKCVHPIPTTAKTVRIFDRRFGPSTGKATYPEGTCFCGNGRGSVQTARALEVGLNGGQVVSLCYHCCRVEKVVFVR